MIQSFIAMPHRGKGRDFLQVLASRMFDRKFYEASYPDVPKGPIASLKHFLAHGGREGRAPSPLFDSEFYLKAYPDVRQAGVNPLLHFLRHGKAEKRSPNKHAEWSNEEKHFNSPHFRSFVAAVRGAKSAFNTMQVDIDLFRIFGTDQPERRSVRRIIADLFLSGTGLEVGALQDPLPVPADISVQYVDRFSKADLYKHYPELQGAALVDVAIVDNGEELYTVPAKSQDFVIANHFLEHTQDPIATLKNFCRVVKPGGYLYLAVPDQTSTFDRDRTPTTLEHLKNDHENGPTSSRHQHFIEWVTLCEPHFGRRYSPEESARRVQELEEKDYSIHFHCWRPQDFAEFLTYCSKDAQLGFTVSLFCRAPGEMVVVLRTT